MNGLSYASGTAPPEYKCSKCGALDCKLWRQYNTFLDHLELMCCVCALKSVGKEGVPVDAEGKWKDPDDKYNFPPSDQLAGLVPAVPNDEEMHGSFWGYSSVPEAGVKWWKRLSTYPPGPSRWDVLSANE